MTRAENVEYSNNTLSLVEVDGASLAIINEGQPECGPARLFIQGLGCEAETVWRPVLNELAAQGDQRQRLAFDPRGIGGSTGVPYSLEQMADDAASIIMSQSQYPVEVIGHSLGGAVAMTLAARHPLLIHSLVLMNTVPRYTEKTASGFKWRADQIRKAGDVSIIFDTVMPRSFCDTTHTERPDVVEAFAAMLSRQSPIIYSTICELAASTDVREALGLITAPMLFISGAADTSTSPEIMQALALHANGRFKEIPDAGHNPPLEQPLQVAAAILANSRAHPRI